MKLSFIPREEKFYEMFNRSAKNVVLGAQTYKELVENWRQDHPNIQKIRDIEHEGDVITHEIVDGVNRTFVTPFDREDIHALASALDNVIDSIQAVSDRMQMYRIDRKDPHVAKLAEILLKSTEEIEKAIVEMSDSKKTRRVLDRCIEINRLENDGDAALSDAVGSLFRDGMNAIDVIKWKEVYEITESAIDRCEDVANTIESVLVKHG
jgi:uncharacterized protein